jgi:hypothetical protein
VPDWRGLLVGAGSKPTHVKQVSVMPIFDENEFRNVAAEIEKSNLSLAKIRSGADSSFYGDDRVFDIKGEVDPPGQRLSIDQQGHLKDVPGLRGSLKYLLQSND